MSPMYLLLLMLFASPQQTTEPSSPEARMAAYEARQKLAEQTFFEGWPITSVGPRAMSGRVVDLTGFVGQPHTYLVAYASGGLWRTTNAGSSWEPLWERGASITIGDFGVNPNNSDEIWLGTGEENSSRSSYAGTGVYHTEDGGKTWTHKGLTDSHHISQILVDPTDPATVYVAVIGRLYSKNAQRGVFRTRDKGATWEKVLYINDNTGVIDLQMDPRNPKVLLAAAWERSRTAWNFVEAGPGSALYRTEDGGDNWTKVNEGLPVGENMGRIALAISPANPDVVYAAVDNQNPNPNPKPEYQELTRKKLRDMDEAAFLALSDKVIDRFLRGNGFHEEITAKTVREQLTADEIALDDLRAYLMADGNADMFDVEVLGVELYRSDDAGKSWRKTHAEPIPDFAWSYGYYFGTVFADPRDENTVYIGAVPLLKTTDGGKTFKNILRPNVHVDHHAMWINPYDPNHLVLGNDGGVNISWDGGDQWQHFNTLPVGQFYTVTYDMATPYNIYGGLQDNGVWMGPSREQDRYSASWRKLGGGDGAFIQVDPRDNATVYLGYQFGNYRRINTQGGAPLTIFPRHRLKEPAYRYNWMTPIVLSQHNHDILYMAGNRILRSMDRGESFTEISPDLTTNPSEGTGDVPFATVTALRESPHAFGTLYAGTDDGRLWITRGAEWAEIGQTITQGLWVSGIEISPHDAGSVFVTLTGYRNDDFRAYVFASDDYGKTWRDLTENLPDEPCNVIRQDRKNKQALYLGTDLGLWVSFDAGKTWLPYENDLPNVPVYAMEIHPRENELIVATHGRSIFTLPLNWIGELKENTLDEALFVFEQSEVTFSPGWGYLPWAWVGDDYEPDHWDIPLYAKEAGTVTVEVKHGDQVVYRKEHAVVQGPQTLGWPYSVSVETETKQPKKKKKKKKNKDEEAEKAVVWHRGQEGQTYAVAGDYTLVVKGFGQTVEKAFTIKESPR
ncbi:WD40/YVTN/BNR-like repeat-containing protein [Acanthopleuribacter pedis]|uniref:Sortilin N-terminal domain-containing protein n=1 Tax=Acanthopleuribacter pedis TaxID=442870 RepID=A0A8J7QQ18_9BACT|nr:sialidase family protein [Acanthopleuribacter pedis]MBO1322523.1 hypothetical protein [Acanthopleuribacter pedis]